MNFLPAQWRGTALSVAGQNLTMAGTALQAAGATLLGVRPEYVTVAAPHQDGAIPAVVTQAQDIGTYWLITTRVGDGDGDSGDGSATATVVRARLSPRQTIPRVGDAVWLGIVGPHTCFYKNEELIDQEATA